MTKPVRTASSRGRPPASTGSGCIRLINPSRGDTPSPSGLVCLRFIFNGDFTMSHSTSGEK
ncbi:hypothetical protein, partial [Pectobacterium parmentieri]